MHDPRSRERWNEPEPKREPGFYRGVLTERMIWDKETGENSAGASATRRRLRIGPESGLAPLTPLTPPTPQLFYQPETQFAFFVNRLALVNLYSRPTEMAKFTSY